MSRSAVRVRSSALQKYPVLQVNRDKDKVLKFLPGLLYTNSYTNASMQEIL
jgi:hypothetical protein